MAEDKKKDDKAKGIPKQRKAGEKGGGGSINQTENREKSAGRGGSAYKGGAGHDEKAKKKKDK